MGKKKSTFNIKKNENFGEWYSEILSKAEVTDLRYGVKGFVVIQPWGARAIDKMYRIYESALRSTGHDPVIFPAVIPEKNFKRESSHVKGFAPEVFWLEKKQGEDRLALRPTSETAFYEMYSIWIRSYRDLPMKLYQRCNVFRNETKATRPLIRAREFHWIETHNVFATKSEAEAQIQEDISMTNEIMKGIFGVPFLPMKRPEWDKFPGAEYTVGSDSIMPDGRVIQQPSTHLISQHFTKAFNIKYVDEKEKEKFAWLTCYGPCISRILASVISIHGDNKGLVLPYIIAPVQVVIIPMHSETSGEKISKAAEKIRAQFLLANIDVKVDETDKRAGEKFFHWEMKGIPFRIDIGERELENGNVSVYIRDTGKKVVIKLENLVEDIQNLGVEFDARLKSSAQKFFDSKIVDCDSKASVKSALDGGRVARISFCSIDSAGEKCSTYIEKDLMARIMGSRGDLLEKATGKCLFCSKKAKIVVYAGKSY
ncbi:MAG: proline--tRNA ligase [Nanoarchaeota archaeon]|nr:proline--tRNA ligase [Nanoarchaeota archaeon]